MNIRGKHGGLVQGGITRGKNGHITPNLVWLQWATEMKQNLLDSDQSTLVVLFNNQHRMVHFGHIWECII